MSERENRPVDPVDDSEIDLLEVATSLGREKRLLLGVPVVFALIAGVISLVMTNKYTAKTVLMPPQQQQSSASAMLDQLGPLAGMALGVTGIKNPADMYAAFLKSNTVRSSLVEKFKLQQRYKKDTLVDTLKELEKNIGVTVEKSSGLIAIEVTDKDPKFAANLANAHIEASQELMGRLSISDAQQRRKFFEEQVEKISAKPFRDIRVQEVILAGLIRQFEMAKIDEAREGPLFQQVDVATIPEKHSKPKRLLMVVIGAFIGIFVGACWGIVRQQLARQLALPGMADQWAELKKAWGFGKSST